MTYNRNDVIAPTAQAAMPAITSLSLREVALPSPSPFLLVMFKSLYFTWQRCALSRAPSSYPVVAVKFICYIFTVDMFDVGNYSSSKSAAKVRKTNCHTANDVLLS